MGSAEFWGITFAIIGVVLVFILILKLAQSGHLTVEKDRELMNSLRPRQADLSRGADSPVYRPSAMPQIDEGQVKCPKCRSTQITADRKGYGLGKAAVGAIALGPLGLLGGFVGSRKVLITCLKCGHHWKP